MFSFRPINKCTDGHNESVVDSLALSSEESGIMECSVTLESSRLELEPFTHGRASIVVSQTSAQSSLSSSLLDLLKPLKKSYTRESEEVRIIKLYKHALRLCSSSGAEDRLAAKPLLESIVGSPLLKSDNLPAQLSSMKFATCKLLGDVYIRTGHHQRGLELFIKAVRMDENDMCLLLRLFRAASHSGAFHIADGALSHLLAQRPCHPIALPLALPFYLALSEFEYCLELAVRALHADPLDERAIFCIQYINKFQPSLMYFLEDILKYRPNLLSESITQKVLDQMNNEVNEVRTIYRKKLDSHADKRKVPSVGFPSPLSPLSWSNLLDSTVKMYDRLDMESAFPSILDLLTLLPPDSPSFSIGREEPNTESDGFPLTTPSTSLSTEAGPVDFAAETPVDQTEQRPVDNKCAVLITECPTKSPPSVVEEAKLGDKNDVNQVDLDVAAEKRRSSRSRSVVDLTDGLNRYRAKRTWFMDDEAKPAPPNKGSKPARVETLDRFRLSVKLLSLLPKVFHDLADAVCFGDIDSLGTPPSASLCPPTPVVANTTDHPPSHDSAESATAEVWSEDSVSQFLISLHETTPNIITFSIALLLQLGQLSSIAWSNKFAADFVYLYDCVRDSFPRTLSHPKECLTNIEEPVDHWDLTDVVLSFDILRLRVPPDLASLTRLHVRYVELRLEQLERFLDRHSSDESQRDPRASEDEYFLSPTTISSLMETLSLYPLDSPGYLRVHAHFLWINYLLCSLRNDYSEMRIYASLLEEHLSTHSITVERNYSVYHGHLTAAYMRVLLEQLDVVSEFESLTELSTQGRHLEVVTKVCDTLRKQRFSERNASDEGPKTVSNYVRQTDRLSLLRCSLRNLICTMSNNQPDTDNQPSDVAEHWAVCYRACGFLLEGTCTLFLRNEPVSTRNSDPIQMEHPRDLLSSIAVDALQMLPMCWHALCDDPAYVTCYTTPADLDTLVPSEVARLPLQIDVCNEPENGIELSSPNEANASKTVLRVGDACYSVSVILNFLAMRLKYSLDPSESFSLSHSLVSLVFEHLVCIERSVPATILPIELQVTMCDTAFDALPVVSKLNFKCGSYPTSPSLLWLHLVHELWSVSPRGSLPPCGCRERPDVLALLKQILLRTSNLLNTVGSSWVPTDPELSELRNLDSSGVQSDHETTSSLSDSDQQTSCDDETVACVDELQHRTVGFWPENSPSLAIILAHAIDCLLPTGLLRDTTVDGLSDDLDALEKWSKFIRESKSTLVPKASPLWLRLRPSCTDLLSFSPPWMRRVMILLNQSLPGSHCKQRSNLASPAWWIQGPATDKLRKYSFLDWECMSILVHFCCPGSLPEYDSVKTLSISVDLLNLLVETTKLLPADEEALFLRTTDVEALLQSKPTDTLKLPRNIVGVSPLSQLIYYLIADHFMKNNSFDLAVEYYLRDLRVCPLRSDSWAGLGLIYYSDLEQIINLTNLRSERVSPEAVSRCLRCFNVALSLLSGPITLLIERGCLAYQLHSYSARLLKKSTYRPVPETHLNVCRKWHTRMLKLARSSYEEVLDVGRGVTHSTVSSTCSSTILVQLDDCLGAPQPDLDNFKRKEQAVEESWLCHYMVAKCAEKEAYITGSKSYGVHGIAPHLLSILRAYNLALDALNAAGAKYPKKIIMYHKLPFRAVESIEVYYRIHALALKTLLHYGLPGPLESKTELPLAELYAFLLGLQSSEFVASAGKPKRGKKRTATVAGIANKGGSIAPLKSLSSQCTAYKEKRPAVSTGLEVAANDVCSLDPGTLERLPHSSSQDEFIDLTSPEPHLPMDDEECPPEDPHPLSTAKTPSALWRECVNLCRAALELVLQRLPLHYKAMFRLADLYCRAPHLRDVSKALAILLGPLDETTKSTIGGLFKDRKQNNFFHGVWRIPTSDIDRSGNFAAHMYRSVHLTLDLLHECGYWRHLVHVFHQLRKQPPEEKRGFLGESDRVYLAKRAFSLIRPTLMTWLTQLLRSIPVDLEGLFSSDPSGASLSSTCSSASFINTETLTQIYRLHCVSFSRNSPATMSPTGTAESKESGQRGATFSALEVSGYAEVLRLAFKLCPSAWDSRGAHIPIEGILKRCAEIASSRSVTVAHPGTSAKTDSGQAPTSPATVRAV